ncbi:MAG: GHKL domain-containing protein [Clostridia bacterium]|nr:GHKL domain-containing protein [Clostridia bacterium]
MKKVRSYHLAAKVAAWLMLVFFFFAFFVSVAGVAVLVRTGAYWDGGRTFREAAAEQVFSFDQVRIRYILREYLGDGAVDDDEYRKMYAKDQSNVFFTVSKSDGTVVVDYSSDDAYQIAYEYEDFFKSAKQEKNETKDFATFAEAQKYVEALEKECHVSAWNYDEITGKLEISYYNYDDITYTVKAFIRKDFTAQDRYYYTLRAVDFIVAMRYWIILVGIAALMLCVLLMVFLCSSAGRTANAELRLSILNRIPLDIFWAVCALFIFSMLFAFTELSLGDKYEWFTVMAFVVLSTSCAILLAASIVTAAARVKFKGWYKNTLIFCLLRFMKKLFIWFWGGVRYLMKNVPLFWKALELLFFIKAVEFVFIVGGAELFVSFWLVELAVLVIAVIYFAVALRKLQRAAREIANGDLDYRADLSGMPGVLKEHGENLNNIGAGLKTALGEQMKSEHMKAELITNVSHDIKTPLTSIVNYVGLLKKEGLGSEGAPEYLEVLERQAAKLKKLTEDLIDASKATSGCIAVNAERMDINVLLAQACGEYEGKLSQSKLTPVLTLAEENPIVYADGGLVWRVFDNLFNNICKYSQKGTRVYLKTEVCEQKVIITFSNISEAQLDISSDELMERFVRGDSSRNTEGSGLGLSIARSLVELQKGSFDIKIDGDLFKAVISFDVMEQG